MSTTPPHRGISRRVLRRETHSPRSTVAITTAVVLVLAAVYLGVELVLEMVGAAPLLLAPSALVQSIGEAPDVVARVVGGAAAVIGLILLLIAITPGRRPRHTIPDERLAVVVDDVVVASALARHASYAGNVSPDSTRVSISKRRAVVGITPATGIAVDEASVQSAVDAQLDTYHLAPAVTARIALDSSGRIGA